MASKDENKWMEWHSKKMMLGGALVFVAGLMRYMGYDWAVVLMAVGALVFIKGLLKKAMMK